jgi:hypothetical protein
MTLRNGQWSNRPDPMYDHSHEYPNSNVCDGPNVSIRKAPLHERAWVYVVAFIFFAAMFGGMCYDLGYFDK